MYGGGMHGMGIDACSNRLLYPSMQLAYPTPAGNDASHLNGAPAVGPIQSRLARAMSYVGVLMQILQLVHTLWQGSYEALMMGLGTYHTIRSLLPTTATPIGAGAIGSSSAFPSPTEQREALDRNAALDIPGASLSTRQRTLLAALTLVIVYAMERVTHRLPWGRWRSAPSSSSTSRSSEATSHVLLHNEVCSSAAPADAASTPPPPPPPCTASRPSSSDVDASDETPTTLVAPASCSAATHVPVDAAQAYTPSGAEYATVLYDYTASAKEELTVHEGEEVIVVHRDMAHEWAEVVCLQRTHAPCTPRSGWVPAAYLKQMVV